jgi:hypothetical protein
VTAIVVYESIWGNTAVLAQAIGRGLGPKTQVLSTSEATPDIVAEADLLVLGAPVHSYNRPEFVTIQVGRGPEDEAEGVAPGSELLLMRDWIRGLPTPGVPVAVFEIRIGDLPGEGGAREVLEALAEKGWNPVVPASSFRMESHPISPGPGGWINPGELERARAWGASLAEAVA